MKILNAAYPFAPVHTGTAGGAEQVVAMLDRELCRAAHESWVVACEGSSVSGCLVPTPAVHGALDEPARRRVRERYRAALSQAIREWKPDVVHLHGIDFLEYLPPEDVPVLATLHLPPYWYGTEVFRVQRPNTWLNCVSASQQRACPPAANMLPFIANGVSPGLFRPDVRKRDFTLALGRICPEKGFHLAFDAAQSAGCAFLLAGEVYPYPEHEQYFREQIVPRCGAERRFIGRAGWGRKRRLLCAAACLLVPSLAPETSSLVAMEAAMSGTPVVAFRSGELPEIVEDGVTGFLVSDEHEMAEAIGKCRGLDPLVCRQAALARFAQSRTAALYLKLYERMARA